MPSSKNTLNPETALVLELGAELVANPPIELTTIDVGREEDVVTIRTQVGTAEVEERVLELPEESMTNATSEDGVES